MAFGNSSNTVSSPVSLSKVTQVFDSVSNGSLRDYLRGSLPYPVVNAYSSIVASGTLALNSFSGAYNPPARLPYSTISLWDDQIGSSASVQTTVSSSGTLFIYEGGSLSGSATWKYAGHQADYDVRFTQISTSGLSSYRVGPTVNVWHSLSTTRTWYINVPSGGFRTGSWNGHLDIRMNASPQTIMANCAVFMSATVEL